MIEYVCGRPASNYIMAIYIELGKVNSTEVNERILYMSFDLLLIYFTYFVHYKV